LIISLGQLAVIKKNIRRTLSLARRSFLLTGALFIVGFHNAPQNSERPIPTIPTLEKNQNDLLNLFLKEDSSSCVLPFNRVGNLILVKAKVDSTEGNFILDTGSPYLVLNIVYFRNYATTVASNEHQTSVSGSASLVERATIKEFSFGSLNYYWEKADMIDLGHIENSKGIKILGLIGLNLLDRCEIIIDNTQNLIYIHKIGKKESKTYKSAQLADGSSFVTMPIMIENQKIVVKTEMAGKKLQFVLDSGAETNILDSRLSEKVFEYVDITGRTNVRGTDNTIIEALLGNLKGMKMGTQNMENLPVLITNLEKTCFSDASCANGVLGLDFLPLQKIGFNFVTRKMYLWK
jgi:hypothetical protein